MGDAIAVLFWLVFFGVIAVEWYRSCPDRRAARRDAESVAAWDRARRSLR